MSLDDPLEVDEAADAAPVVASPSDTGPRREHAGGILGIAGALFLLLSTFLVLLLGSRSFGAVDGRPDLVGIFGDAAPPFGFVLAEAAVLPTQERVLRLVPAQDGPPVEGAPAEIVLLLYRSSAALQQIFQPPPSPFGPPGGGGPGGMQMAPGQRLAQWERERNFAWHTTVKRDEILWYKWRAAYAIERAMRADGTWAESVRVNLDQVIGEVKSRHLLLTAQWPDGEHVDLDALRKILLDVHMLEGE